jgi:hypothetical protein
LILRHRYDGAAGEGAGHEHLDRAEQRQRDDVGHQHAQRRIDSADVDAEPDIGGFDVAIVDA